MRRREFTRVAAGVAVITSAFFAGATVQSSPAGETAVVGIADPET
jgi:hypothetical protein